MQGQEDLRRQPAGPEQTNLAFVARQVSRSASRYQRECTGIRPVPKLVILYLPPLPKRTAAFQLRPAAEQVAQLPRRRDHRPAPEGGGAASELLSQPTSYTRSSDLSNLRT